MLILSITAIVYMEVAGKKQKQYSNSLEVHNTLDILLFLPKKHMGTLYNTEASDNGNDLRFRVKIYSTHLFNFEKNANI